MAEEKSGDMGEAIIHIVGFVGVLTFFEYHRYASYGLYGSAIWVVFINAILTILGFISLIGSYKLGENLNQKGYFYDELYEYIYSIVGTILVFIGTVCLEMVILIILAGHFTNPLSFNNTPQVWINNITNSFWYSVISNLIWSVIAIGITSRFVNYMPSYLGFVLVSFVGGIILGSPILGLVSGLIYGAIAVFIVYLIESH